MGGGGSAAARRVRAGARWRAWIGVVALLFYSALPLAHHARAAAPSPGSLPKGTIVYELCTPDGLRLVEIPPADSNRKDAPSHRPYSCPICQALQHAQAALPPVIWTAKAPTVSVSVPPPPPTEAAPRRLVVTVSQPRAPPPIG
jgi:Protein of unknown function (DUF2946)